MRLNDLNPTELHGKALPVNTYKDKDSSKEIMIFLKKGSPKE
jgi:hypothetical protein